MTVHVPRFANLALVPEPADGQVVRFTAGQGYSFGDPVAGAPADGSIITVMLADGAVTNEKLAPMAAITLKGRGEGAGSGDPQDLTLGSSLSMTGTVLSMILENRTDDPASPVSGQVWLRTDL